MANYNFSYNYEPQQPYLNNYYQQQVPGLVSNLQSATAPTLGSHLGNLMAWQGSDRRNTRC